MPMPFLLARTLKTSVPPATPKAPLRVIARQFSDVVNGEAVALCQRVNFRFMGLFDTVLSTNFSGTGYNLGIPGEFAYVAQAVALNEHRSGIIDEYGQRNPKPHSMHQGGFPLESIGASSYTPGQVRIERGFLGAHSDIGGGFPDGDLAKVALLWMVEQAKAAGVDMRPPTAEQESIIANPVIHDRSTNLLQGGPTATSEDRTVRYLDGSTEKQRQANTFGMNWGDTLEYIAYKPDPNTLDSIAGTVDMHGYLEWLDKNGYGVTLNVQ